MRAILLCGGIGRRMRPLSVEKPLLRFGRETLVERLVRLVRPFAEEVVAITNPANHGKISGMVDRAWVQERPDGIGMALLESGFLMGDVLIINPNDVFEESLVGMVAERDMAIPAATVDSYFPGGYVVEENGMLRDVIEKPGEGNEPGKRVKMVFDKLDGTELRRFLERERGEDSYEKALAAMAKELPIEVVEYGGRWKAIKYPRDILDAMPLLVEGVVMEETARVSDSARIEGNVYIGNGAFVGDFSLVRDSVILDGVVIGANSEVARSYIMEGSSLHRNYVGDSVIGRNVLMGAGAVIANMRFDRRPVMGREKLGAIIGDGARIGINASIMPGSIIGEGETVMPGATRRAGKGIAVP